MFSQQQLKTLQNIIAKKLSYQSKAKWLVSFCEDTGIGSIKNNTAIFGMKDIDSLENYLVANDYTIKNKPSDFNDRIEASKYFGKEKITKNAVTHDRVLALFPKRNYILEGQTLPIGRAIDLTISEALSLDVKELVVVENLAVFLNAKDYKNLLSMLVDDSMLIFRGMAGCYSLKGSVSLLGEFLGERIGLFDFDPVGINAIGHRNIDSMLAPSLADLKDGLLKGTLKSDPDKFSSQNKRILLKSPSVHITFMSKNRLAVSQEHMIATNFKLEKIKVC